MEGVISAVPPAFSTVPTGRDAVPQLLFHLSLQPVVMAVAMLGYVLCAPLSIAYFTFVGYEQFGAHVRKMLRLRNARRAVMHGGSSTSGKHGSKGSSDSPHGSGTRRFSSGGAGASGRWGPRTSGSGTASKSSRSFGRSMFRSGSRSGTSFSGTDAESSLGDWSESSGEAGGMSWLARCMTAQVRAAQARPGHA